MEDVGTDRARRSSSYMSGWTAALALLCRPALAGAAGPSTAPQGPAAPSAAASAPTPAHPAEPAAEDEADGPTSQPRMTVAGHVMVGPHSAGEDSCALVGGRTVCDQTGAFLGVGGSVELRGRLYRFVHAHGRLQAVGNVAGSWKPSPAFDGLVMPGLGIGIYAPIAFLRVEALAPITLGSGRYRAADTNEAAEERWGHVAGSLTAGLRLRLADRWRGEAFGGFMLGPRAERDSPNGDFYRKRVLLTFVFGLGVSFDVLE